MARKILLVEDDESLGFVTKDNLVSQGYVVELCADGRKGLSAFSKSKYDICLLDVMLPKMDGFSLAENIRKRNHLIPIIFLTARSMQEDKLEGFKKGGDDYVTKPFSIEELIYRIESCLKRRGNEIHKISVKTVGQLALDLDSYVLKSKTKSQKLTQRESEILEYLIDHIGMIVKREDILVAIWGDNDYFKGRSLDVFISKIRKYLKMDPAIDIENHHGIGFKLIDINQRKD
ncbi:MAG: response regulator transcription factor [Reichenbachiella sp.]